MTTLIIMIAALALTASVAARVSVRCDPDAPEPAPRAMPDSGQAGVQAPRVTVIRPLASPVPMPVATRVRAPRLAIDPTPSPTPSTGGLTPADAVNFVRQVEADTIADASDVAFVPGQSTTHCRAVIRSYYTGDGGTALEYDYSPMEDADGAGVSGLRDYFPGNQWRMGDEATRRLYMDALSQIADVCDGLDAGRP